MLMNVRIIPILADNYSYLITNLLTRECILIDPAEPSKILPYLTPCKPSTTAQEVSATSASVTESSNLIAILCTHHHDDHAGGNRSLLETYPVPVYGGDSRIQCISHIIQDDEKELKIGKGFNIQVLKTPGHTIGSVCYYFQDDDLVFTGDTLFSAGCGRFFEGTAHDMLPSLSKLVQLPHTTLVYPGHEYTKKNLEFSVMVEPDNDDAKNYLKQIMGKPITVPSRLLDEVKMNPFLRTHSTTIQKTCDSVDPITVLATLREMKNKF